MTPSEKARDNRLKREYHITLEEYNIILKHQGYRCAICRKYAKSFKTRLAVDHCHTQGWVRGLLCMTCNRALAKFRDSIDLLESAAYYLFEFPATAALGSARKTAGGRVGTLKRAKLLKAMKKDRDES